MSNENYVAIDREELERLRADSAELARLKEPVAWEYQKAALAEHSNWIRNRTTDQAVEYLWKKGWRIAPEPTPEGFVLVPVEPTEAMLDAGACHVYEPTHRGDCEHVWTAMLAAAPKGDGHE